MISSPRRRVAVVSLLVAIASASSACGSAAGDATGASPSALERETDAAWNIVYDAHFGTVTFAEPRTPGAGPVVRQPGAPASEAAYAFLDAHRSTFALRAPRDDLALEAEGTDGLGLGFATFTPRVAAGGGALASPTRLGVHFDRGGRVAFVAGRYAATTTATTQTAGALREASRGAARAAAVQRRCVHLDGNGHGVRYYAAPPLHDGGDTKTFEITAANGGYEMRRDRAKDASALVCQDGSPSTAASAGDPTITSDTRTSWDVRGSDAGAAVDAYYHAGKALEFYRTQLGRDSYDGAGAPLTVVVHGEGGGASYSEGTIFFASPPLDRPSPKLSYAGAFDAVAHELQHGVTASTLRLSDGGAEEDAHAAILDEAISDIFGAFAEHWLRPGDANLTVGEAVAAPGYPPTRDLMHPSRCLDVGCSEDCGHRACPDHLSRLDPLTDPHRSTGIASNAWALMTVGGQNDTSGVRVDSPLGWDASLTLWYALVVSRAVAPAARFEDVARATVALARHSGADGASVRAVACAWVAVGVIDEPTAARFWNLRCAGT